MSSSRQQPDIAAIQAALDEDDFILVPAAEDASASQPIVPVDADLEGFHVVEIGDLPPDDDNTALLQNNQSPGITYWVLTGTQRVAASAANTVLYAVKHPVTTVFAVTTATPSAMYALSSPLSPRVIGKAWWDSLTAAQKAHATANGGSSLVINTLINFVFLPQAWATFVKTAPHTFDSPRQFAENATAMTLAGGAAVATGAIAVAAFSWLPAASVTAYIPASLSFISALASRYVGVTSLFTLIKNLFSDNLAAQKELLDIINHLDPESFERLQAEFRNIIDNVARHPLNDHAGDSPPNKPLTKGQFYEVTKQLAAKLDIIISEAKAAGKHPVRETTFMEQAQRYAGMAVDGGLGLVLAVSAFLIHDQKGFEGIKLLGSLMGSKKLDALDSRLKFVLGIVPGIAPGMLYGVCAMELRAVLVHAAKEVYRHPGSLPLALVLTAATGFSATGMLNVANGIAANPDNIIGIGDKAGTYASLLRATAAAGAATTNGKPTFEISFKPAPPTLNNLTLDGFVEYSGNPRNVVSNSTTTALRGLTMFNNARPGATHVRQSDRDLEAQVESRNPAFAGGLA